jgi:hypothetical protein
MVSWFMHVAGLDDGSGAWYLWWSGIVGDLALVGAAISIARHVNCHSHGCWRIARHPVAGTPYKTCARHHPTVPSKVTVEQIHAAHETSRS